MADILKLEVEGEPVAWSAPLIFRQGQKKSERLVRWQTTIRIGVQTLFPDDFEMWDCPILVRYLVVRRTRGKHVKDKWPSRRADLDNFEKAIWDALQGVVYTDDARIVYKMSVQKIWATEDNPPGVSLQIERME